jgi:protein TonB
MGFMAKQSIEKLRTLTRIVRGITFGRMCIYLLSIQFCIFSFGISSACAEPLQQSNSVQNKPPISDDELAKRALEIARLEAEINKVLKDYDKQPRRTFSSRKTNEVRYKKYIEECVAKISSVVAITSSQVAGETQLSISIKRDGSVEEVRVSQSSGRPLLDKTAIQMAQVAAPFQPFPPEIAKDTDILTIVHTFKISITNQ